MRRALAGRIANQYVVVLNPGVDPDSLGSESAGRLRGRLKHVYRRALRGFSIRLTESAADALSRDPRVAYVAEDVTVHATAIVPTYDSWGLDRIDQRDVPLDSSYTYFDDGAGVNVYVVDSGVRETHVDFGGRVRFGGEFTDDDLDRDPNDILNDDPDPTRPDGGDCNGHGTHVAGLIGGQRYGVAKGVTIWSYRAMRCTSDGQGTDVLAAVDTIIADHQSPAVLNLSLVANGFTPLDDAVRRAIAAGITVVVAAGNDNSPITYQSPATVPEAIVVASTTDTDERAAKSNYGPLIDLFAPGDRLPSASHLSDTGVAYYSGTSMAAPHVAGAAALYLQTHPYASPAEVRNALVGAATPNRVVDAGAGSPNLLLFAAFRAPATPFVVVAPSPIAFSAQRTGTSSGARTVTVSNRGSGILEMGAVTVAGSARTDFAITRDGCSGRTVTPTTACVVELTFTPSAVGTRAATLSLASNALDSPSTVSITGIGAADAGTAVPTPWSTRDIGTTGVIGSATFAGGAFTISGAGADVWGTADAFHFTYQSLPGDGSIVARVTAVQGSDAWTKVGVMIRQSLGSASAHAFMLVSSGKGLAFQSRTTAGGTTTTTTPTAGGAPRWLRLTRAGQTISAASSTDGSTWTTVGQSTIAMTGPVYVGLAVSSHNPSLLASARFEQVTVSAVNVTSPPPVLGGAWSTDDIGNVGVAGSATESNGTFTVKGAGADIWGADDAFRFVFQPLDGDGTITARLASLAGSENWTKAGVMIRDSLTPGSAHATMLTSIGKGAAFQRRTVAGGLTTSTSGGAASAPRWLRIARRGNRITASMSVDGTAWTTIGQDTLTMGRSVYVGLAVSSHLTTQRATATFDKVAITADSTLPQDWTGADVGATGTAGSSSATGSTFTVRGAGADIWGAADAFQFAYRPLIGNGSIVARVSAIDGVHAWTKAGVMIRNTLDANAPHATLVVSSGKGLAFQRRTSAGGASTSTVAGSGSAPRWVRLTRSGSTITASVSSNGSTWTVAGQDTIDMNATVWVGLAVSSHDPARLATATFDNVLVN